MENQEDIWNAIAKPWSTFRLKPLNEVVKFLENKKGKILDLGCGSGRNFMKFKGTIYGVDFSEKMLEFAKEYSKKKKIKAKFVKAEIFDLPFKDNFFDSAVFIAVLHCIPTAEKREKTLLELFRVLKPNSEALITVWDKDQERFENSARQKAEPLATSPASSQSKESFLPWKHDGKEYMRYYYLYDKKEILDSLKKVGFEIIKISDKESPDGFYSKKNIDIIVKK